MDTAEDLVQAVIPAPFDGERVDRTVAGLGDMPRSAVEALISSGQVSIDGNVITKASVRVQAGQEIEFPAFVPVDESVEPDASVNFEVVAETNDYLVIDKAPGVTVHPGAGIKSGTLVNGVVAKYPEIATVGDPARPGIVHRLDKGTSGLMVVARTQVAYENLVKQLSTREVSRTYLAIVRGVIESDSGEIDAPIGRSSKNRLKMSINEDGRDALTGYSARERFEDSTFVELNLSTGRTHQIRVHMEAIGHPVIGDPIYAAGRQQHEVDRPMLHATRLVFDDPTSGESVTFESPIPADMSSVLDGLRKAAKNQ